MRTRHRYLPFDAMSIAYKGYEYASDPAVKYLSEEKMAPVSSKRKLLDKFSQATKKVRIANIPASDTTGYSTGIGSGKKKTYKKKGVDVKKAKAVSVTKSFKAKVQKSLAAEQIWGSVRALCFGKYLWNGANNNQSVVYLSPLIAGSSQFGMDWLWSTDMFLHWASVLWNGKAPNNPTSATQTFGSLGVRQPDNFNCTNFICHIKGCSMEYKFRNTGQNGVLLTIHQLKPRIVGSFTPAINTASGFQYTTNTNVARLGTPSIPETDWNEAMTDETQVDTQLGAAAVTLLGLEPKMCKSFRSKYIIETTYITLEAGQTTNYFVRGPQDLNMDYSKYLSDDFCNNIQKFSRGFICTISNMPTITVAAGLSTDPVPARLPSYINTAVRTAVNPYPAAITVPAPVIVEREFHLTMSMPPNTTDIGTAIARKRLDVADWYNPNSVPVFRNPENPDDFTSGAIPQ